MARELLLLRHAKSDWDASYGGDHERPLNDRGVESAHRVGRWLAGNHRDPDLIVSSTAVRALTTARLVREAGELDSPIEKERALYLADLDTVRNIVRSTPDSVQRLMLVGHEPTWSGSVGRFIGAASVRMPTAAVACIVFEHDHWSEVGTGQLRFLVTPKLIAGATGH